MPWDGNNFNLPFSKSLITLGLRLPCCEQILSCSLIFWALYDDKLQETDNPFPVFFLWTLAYLKAMSEGYPKLFYTLIDNTVFKCFFIYLNAFHKYSSLAVLEENVRNMYYNSYIKLSSSFFWVTMHSVRCGEFRTPMVPEQKAASQLWEWSLNWQ